METTIFDQTSETGKYLKKTFFKLFWCFEAFSRKLTENFSFGSRKWYLKAYNYSVFFFYQQIWKGENSDDYFDLIETTFFGQTREMGQILPKTIFILKMSHIKLN